MITRMMGPGEAGRCIRGRFWLAAAAAGATGTGIIMITQAGISGIVRNLSFK